MLRAAFSFSTWAPVMFLFPFLAPMVRLLAFVLPDKGLLKMKAARRTIVDAVSTLIQEHRFKLEVVFCPLSLGRQVLRIFFPAREAHRQAWVEVIGPGRKSGAQDPDTGQAGCWVLGFRCWYAAKLGGRDLPFVAAHAAFAPSTVWTPVMFLFPFLSPLVRCLAWLFPDSGMLKMKRSAEIIINIVSANIEQRRQEMRAEVLHPKDSL